MNCDSRSRSHLKVAKSKRNEEAKETTYLSPSDYTKQLSLNPESVIRKKSNDKKQPRAFAANPKAIIFPKFVTGNVYNVNLQIQNTSEVPHQLRLASSESVIFKISYKGSTSLNARLAPGMAQVYDVEFRPDEAKDYFYEINFKTDLGCFVVPVIACGPKAVLSFPDQIDMGQTALKVTRTKPILMQNTGNVATGFSLFTDNHYFTISPSKGTIKVDEPVQLAINFTPLRTGISNGRVFLRYDSGDTVQSAIYGEAVSCDIRVRDEDITFENTHLSLSRLTTVEIVNNSDYLVHFEWMNYKSIGEDVKEKRKKVVEPSLVLPRDDDISQDLQELISRRVHEDSLELIKSKSLTYDNDHFTIFPTCGEVWPCKSMQMSVTFHPKTVGSIISTAYLEIDGLDHRIPVSLSGKCLGPALELNLLSLDVQEVYLCSSYIYQVLCKNSGPIPGTLIYINKNADFGSTIEVEPSEIKIDVNELKSTNLSFRSNRTGNFIERIDFLIKESSEVLSFVMKGKVICPLIRTEPNEEISFRLASLGFASKKSLSFHNLSHEAVEFSFKVPTDGYEKCLVHEDLAKNPTKTELPACPREFFLCPSEGVVAAGSPLHMQIFYTPNIARCEDIELQIDLCKSSNAEPLILPMSIDADSASFSIAPEDLRIRFCFVNLPYCRKLTVTNVSELEGYFYIKPQTVLNDTTILYSLSTYHGTLKPNQSKEITLTLIVKAVGEQKLNLYVHSLGLEEPVVWSEITCIGQGPVISVEPSRLNWGEVRLLCKKSLDLTIVNDSPISAEFSVHLSKTKNIWEIEPSHGELEPNESIALKVTIFLRDTGSYSDRLVISILNGKSVGLSLSAIGVGTCIVFEPDIFPDFDLGIHFCRQNISIPVKVKNEGTRFHHILLTNEEKIKQGKKASANDDAENAKFKIEPNVIELRPGEMQTIYCKTRQNTNKTITEPWYINATLDGQGKRELLGTSNITATFVEPNIRFDKRELTFRLDLGHNSETFRQKDQVEITNESGRSVTAHITIDPPFVLIDLCNCRTDAIDVILANDESICARVCFLFDVEASEPIPQKYQGYLRISYDEHRAIDKLLCVAEVNFPHVICAPSELQMYCVHGWSSEETVKIINDSPLPVAFKVKWLKNTFEYQCLASLSEDGTEEGATCDKNSEITICPSTKDNDSDLTCYCTNNSDVTGVHEEGWSESSSEIQLPCIDLIDQFLQITPKEGLIAPYSETFVTVTFNGFERAKLSIRAVCEVARGLSKLVTVDATADDVRCDVQDYYLDFGLQLYCEPSVSRLRIKNQCMIPLNYNIETSTSLLDIVQCPKLLEPSSESLITIGRRASAPGLFDEKLFLEVMHLEPFIIEVRWLATIPQVYLETSATEEFEFFYQKRFDYEAIQLLTSEWMSNQEGHLADAKCSSSDIFMEDREFSEFELMQLTDNDWHIIAKDNRYPSQIDIIMASERLRVKRWMEENENDLPIDDSNKLSTSLYEINMKYVIVGRTKQISIPLNNYGFEKAKVKLIRSGRKAGKSVLTIQLEKNIEICQCESSTLCIAFSPKREMFSLKRTCLNDKFYLDVKQGLKIPVSVQVIAVYPDVSVIPEKLNFGKVFVGECRESSFILRNDDDVDCEWEIIIEHESKSLESPFYVHNTNDVFKPSQEMKIKVYYKPNKHGKQKASLIIAIANGLENKTINLTGFGVDRKIEIDKSKIRFAPLIPSTGFIEDDFIVKNKNDYPIELYWKHKNDFSEFNQIVRILRHYYATKDILIPKRKIGEGMPKELVEFYDFLVRQMCMDQDFQPIFEKHKIEDDNSQKSDGTNFAELDAAEIESLLHVYIDKIQKNTNFIKTTGDPLEKLLKNSTRASSIPETPENLPPNPKKKLIIIFHGSPGTEYQETACTSAKALGLPLLNLNNIILESLALANTPSAIKLSDQINQRYKDLTTKLEKLAAVVSARSTPANNDHASRILQLMRTIPPVEEFDRVDSYTAHEMKLEVIQNLVESSDFKEKSSVKSQDLTGRRQSVLPGVSQDTVREILKDRLASGTEFAKGYVLQSLDCDYFKSETVLIKMLLEASGEAEFYLFVTFFDSYELASDFEEQGDGAANVSKLLQEYRTSLNRLVEAIGEWETGKSVTNELGSKRAKSGKNNQDSMKNEFLAKLTEKFFVWYVQPSDAQDRKMYDSTVLNIWRDFGKFIKDSCEENKKAPSQALLTSQTYSILKERHASPNTPVNEIFQLSESSKESRSIEKHRIILENSTIEDNDLFRHKKSISRAWSSTPELAPLTRDSSHSSDLDVEATLTIQAHETKHFRVKFAPNEEGHFQNEFALSLMDEPESTFRVQVEGVAEIPRVVCLDLPVLDFGNLLVLPENMMSHKKLAFLKMKNISTVFANITFSLTDENYDCFDIESRQMELEPLEEQYLHITACTKKLGITSDTLILNVQHNDQSESIQLHCTGIELDIEIDPKRVNLERVLLYRTESKMIAVRNKSAIDLFWRLSIDNDDDKRIRFLPTQNKIKSEACCEIELQYYAGEVSKGSKTTIANFEVFLNETDTQPIKTDIINVTAEVYEILYNLQADDPVDLGKIPVRSAAEKSFVLKNMGSYGIRYEWQYQNVDVLKKMLDKDTLAVLEQDIKIYPVSGLVPPKKQATINVVFTPSIEMRINSVALFKCAIIESYKEYDVVHEHLLNLSATSYYTKFLIEPHPKLDFGSLELKTLKTMQLKITNTGRFSLKYSILSAPTNDLDDRSSIITDRGKRSSKQRKLSKRPSTLQNASMKWGPFQLDKIKGELTSGQIDTINVRCVSETIGRFNEKLSVLVLDSLPLADDDQQILLVADVCVAKLNFYNYNEMFAGSHVVDSFDDFFCPSEFGEYTVFSKTSTCLYFYRVHVGGSHTASIALRNIGAVNGDVLLEISDESVTDGVFQIDQNRASISSMCKQSFTLTFSPKSLGIFSAKLTMRLELPENIDPQTFSVDLKGEGCVPQIQLIEPDLSSINYGLTFVSTCNKKLCKIKNIGKIPAKVIVKLLDDPKGFYGVLTDENENTPVRDTDLTIRPEGMIGINIAFFPNKIGKYESRLQISIEYNPYDMIEVKLTGEGFTRSVILDNLELADRFLSNDKESVKRNSRDGVQKTRKSSLRTSADATESKLPESSSLTYKLDYGNCFLNQRQKVTFKIANKTCDKFFRFAWDSFPNLVCTPTAGHLGPNSFKELTATFLSSEPITMNQLPLSCEINEIILDEPILEPLWDNRQTSVSWTEKYLSTSELETDREHEEDVFMKKVVREIQEPKHEVVPETLQTMQLVVSVNADYSNYQCDTDAINFEDTLMFQTSVREFILKNTGTVDLSFSWCLAMDEQYPMRLDQTSLESNSSTLEAPPEAPCTEKRCALGNITPALGSRKFLQFDCSTQDSSKNLEESDLFSSSAGLTDRSTDSWIEGENWPFEILPENASVPPGQSIECTLKFSPVDVFDYKAQLQCKMENLDPCKQPLNIAVAARSLLPYCHFEIDESDYLTSGRRDAKLPIPSGYSFVDPVAVKNIRVAEFKIFGIGECHILHVCFVNPTCEDYSYHWSNLSNQVSGRLPLFQCLNKSGVAEKGKRSRISFSVVPENVGLFESFWQFEIKKYDLKTLFILVVNVVEPLVCCRKSMMKLKESTTDQITIDSFDIMNNDCCPLSFNIVKDSLYSEGRLQAISICPMSGEINPCTSQIFNVTFEPSLIGEHNFNVRCKIEKLQKPIEIFISARVLEILSCVTYADLDGREIDVCQGSDNTINVGQMPLNVSMKIKFKIMNIGQLAFDYSWTLSGTNQNAFKICLSQLEGQLEKNCHDNCCLKLMATEKAVLRNYPITMKIKYGPTYRIKLNASAVKPPVEFSFSHYDFGLCYIKTENGVPYFAELSITNNQKIACTINCNFCDNPNIKLDHYQLQQAIPPKSSIEIPIYFQPTEETSYQQILHFQVPNVCVQKDVVIRGEGIAYKVHLEHPCDAVINIGPVAIGKTICRKLAIINEGRSTVTLRILAIDGNIIDYSDSGSTTKNSQILEVNSKLSSDSAKSSNILDFIEISPDGWFDLKPNKEKSIAIKFQALRRCRSCDVQLTLDLNGAIVPLTLVKAKCIATSLCLNKTYVSFGTIFESCTAQEKLILTNDGDLDARFCWVKKNVTSDFEIYPESGCCLAGRDTIFTCTFKPSRLGSCLQAEAILELKDYKRINVNMIGNCCSLPEAIDVIDFTSEPNKTDVKEVKIENDSDKTWNLVPKITGDRFKTDELLSIQPKNSSTCNIIYNPMKQHSKESYDNGKLVIILPNGRSPIVYELRGHCTQVESSKKFMRQVPAKKKFMETLAFFNDTPVTRTFVCNTNELTDDTVKNISSFEVDLAGYSQMKRKFLFYFENPGSYFYKITFVDPNGNNQCYEIEFTVTSSEAQKIIEMITFVRSPTFCTLKIENPLEYKPLTFHVNEIADIVVHGLPIDLMPLEFKNIRIEYLPLLPCDKQELLIIKSDDHDEISYELHLTAKPAPPEKITCVKSSLGSGSDFALKIKNYTKESCDFDLTANNPAFTSLPTINLPANEESWIRVRFEPYSLEKIDATIVATSSTAGEFTFPVIGECTPPQPEGPFTASLDAPAIIKFKNVFLETKQFNISVDNSNFIVENSKASIKSKESFDVRVQLRASRSSISSATKTGKLIITCSDATLASIKWIYYIRGVHEKQ